MQPLVCYPSDPSCTLTYLFSCRYLPQCFLMGGFGCVKQEYQKHLKINEYVYLNVYIYECPPTYLTLPPFIV